MIGLTTLVTGATLVVVAFFMTMIALLVIGLRHLFKKMGYHLDGIEGAYQQMKDDPPFDIFFLPYHIYYRMRYGKWKDDSPWRSWREVLEFQSK